MFFVFNLKVLYHIFGVLQRAALQRFNKIYALFFKFFPRSLLLCTTCFAHIRCMINPSQTRRANTMQTHTDTRSPLPRESTARIIKSDAPAKPNARLPQATMPRAADRPAKYRHEYKYEISLFDFFSLTRMLRTIMQPDPHADQDGQYLITSLYFDNCFDKALREKRDGLNQREKFRLR